MPTREAYQSPFGGGAPEGISGCVDWVRKLSVKGNTKSFVNL